MSSQLVSLITDWRLEVGAGMTNTPLKRETTENYEGEEVTPDIIWQTGNDRVIQLQWFEEHPPDWQW